MSTREILWPGLTQGFRLRATELVLLALLQSAIVLALAWAGKTIVSDSSVAPGHAAVGLVSLLGLAAILRLRERYASEQFAVRHVHVLRMRMFDYLSTRPALDESKAVNTVRFASDLTAIRQWAAFSMGRLFSGAMLTAAIVGGLWLLHPTMAKLLVGVLSVALLVVPPIGRRLQRAIRAQRAKRARLTHRIGEILDHLALMQRSGRTASERSRLERASLALSARQTDRGFWSGALRAAGELTARAGLIAIVVLVWMGDRADGGTLILALLLVSLLQGALRDLTRVFEYWQSAEVAAAKISPLVHPLKTDAEVSASEGAPILTLQAGTLPSGLQLPPMTVAPGTSIAISGDDEHTLRQVFLTLAGHLPTSELIRLGDVPVDQFSEGHRAEKIGLVLRDDPLIEGSLSKNLRYRAQKAKKSALRSACNATGVAGWIGSLAAGFDTRRSILETRLTPEQRTQLRWCRAILGTPDVVLIEGADRDLAPDSRRAIAKLIKSYAGIVIFTAQSNHLVAVADQVWHVEDQSVHISQAEVAA